MTFFTHHPVQRAGFFALVLVCGAMAFGGCCGIFKKCSNTPKAFAQLTFYSTDDSNEGYPLQVRFFVLTDSAAFMNSTAEQLFKMDRVPEVLSQLGVVKQDVHIPDLLLDAGSVGRVVSIADSGWMSNGNLYLAVAANYIKGKPGSDRLVLNVGGRKRPFRCEIFSQGEAISLTGDRGQK